MARVKPLAELIEGCIGPAFAAQGFASTDILAAWPEIVGERLARYCRPSKLEWPKRRRREPTRPNPGRWWCASRACSRSSSSTSRRW